MGYKTPHPRSSPTTHARLQCHHTQGYQKKFLADYIYKSCFSPPRSTLLKAINNNHFLGWPGIDDTSVKRLLSETMATAKGHLDQEQQHLQTTKHTTHDDDTFPPTMPPTIKAYNTFTLLFFLTAIRKLRAHYFMMK